MWSVFKNKLPEVLKAVAPLVVAGCALHFAVARVPTALFLQFLAGSALAVVGLVALFTGIDLGILPMGRFIGAELPRRGSILLIVLVAFAIGFATTVAEPDVLVLGTQIDAIAAGTLSGHRVILVIALGLAVLSVFAMVRIVFGWPMKYFLTAGYLAVIALALIAPPRFVPLAFDGGSVTTGVLSAPVVIAIAIGLSSVLAGRSALSDGFGLVGFASIGPIIAVLILGLLQ